MSRVIGIRRETKSPWERRVPLVPTAARRLIQDQGLRLLVQPAPRRVFADDEFADAGCELSEDLSAARVIFGVKEIPPQLLQPETTYIFFSHVIKGQHYNMPMLARLMELGCTLIDYEKVRDEVDRRLIFFGRFAGLAGMIDTLWALGRRLLAEGISTPFAEIRQAHAYDSLDDAKAAIRRAGETVARAGLPEQLVPLVVGVTGYGNVAQGAQEILQQLPTAEITPQEVVELRARPEVSSRTIYRVTYREEDLVEPNDPAVRFELQDYYRHPDRYHSVFTPHLGHLSVLVNCNYWDERYPRLVPNDALRSLYGSEEHHRLRVIGDLSCDIEGSVQCTVKTTEPGDPVYVYDPFSGTPTFGVEGRGPVVLAVDILPAELPRDASKSFSETLEAFVPAIAQADYSQPFERLALPPEIKRAVIVHRGELTEDFRYIDKHLNAAAAQE